MHCYSGFALLIGFVWLLVLFASFQTELDGHKDEIVTKPLQLVDELRALLENQMG